MLNFKQYIDKDLDDIFFSVEAMEFATTHKIAGTRGNKASTPIEFQVVVDHELYVEHRLSSKAENISLNGLIFFIKKSDWIKEFEIVPKVDSSIYFDGERYLVSAAKDNMGILEITLESYRG